MFSSLFPPESEQFTMAWLNSPVAIASCFLVSISAVWSCRALLFISILSWSSRCSEGGEKPRWAWASRVCKRSVVLCTGATFLLFSIPLCCLLALLLDETLSELFTLSLLPALKPLVLAHQARDYHLGVSWLSFPQALRVVQVILPLARGLLVLLIIADGGLYYRRPLLHLTIMAKTRLFAIIDHFSICTENKTNTHFSRNYHSWHWFHVVVVMTTATDF